MILDIFFVKIKQSEVSFTLLRMSCDDIYFCISTYESYNEMICGYYGASIVKLYRNQTENDRR
jgi:hypothetical protein